MNEKFKSHGSKTFGGKICILFCGNASPGGNNVIDGLLKFQLQKKGLEVYGYMNGSTGIMDQTLIKITEDSFAPYRNLGGYDYLGKSSDQLSQSHFEPLGAQCKANGIHGHGSYGVPRTGARCGLTTPFAPADQIGWP